MNRIRVCKVDDKATFDFLHSIYTSRGFGDAGFSFQKDYPYYGLNVNDKFGAWSESFVKNNEGQDRGIYCDVLTLGKMVDLLYDLKIPVTINGHEVMYGNEISKVGCTTIKNTEIDEFIKGYIKATGKKF